MFPKLFLVCALSMGVAAISLAEELGNPGGDVGRARAHLSEVNSQRLKWELETTLEDYNRIGSKDPRWDDEARVALAQNAQILAGDGDIPALMAAAKVSCQRAQAAGCNDPLVAYVALRLKCYPPGLSQIELAGRYAEAERALEASEYTPIRKCYASMRVAQQVCDSTRSKTPRSAEVTNEIRAALSRARTHFVEVLSNPAAQRGSVYDLADGLFNDLGRRVSGGRAQILDPMATLFISGIQKEGKDGKDESDEARDLTVEGIFWTHYAWDARSSDWAEKVGEPARALFEERLLKAEKALEKAWARDPVDPRAPLEMMRVELGQGRGRERLETWFRRAMDANPDSFEACLQKMLYLAPKWYGTPKEMIEFGDQCLATGNWKARLPFILLRGLSMIADAAPAPAKAELWKSPEVWAEVQKFYTACLAANPDSVSNKSAYALYAYRAEQWKQADALFTALGDKPDLQALECTQPQYESMKNVAAKMK